VKAESRPGSELRRERRSRTSETPAIANDGTVVFGAMVQTQGRGYWRILRADPKATGQINAAIDDEQVSEYSRTAPRRFCT